MTSLGLIISYSQLLNLKISNFAVVMLVNLNLGPMAATCRFRLLLGPPTLRDRDLCKMVVKISTWSALLYLAISNRCTRNWRENRDKK